MPSTAISSKDYVIRVATANGSSKVISGATQANPVVITSTAHGLANGTVVFIDSVGGMVELNGRAFVIANQATNTFELKGIDGTTYTAYTSGGTALPKTMTRIENLKGSSLFEGTTPEIDVTNQDSRRREYVIDIPDSGQGSLTIDVDASGAGQARLRALKGLTTSEVFSATDRNGKVAAFVAFVTSFPVNTAVGSAVNSQVSLRITNEEAWFA